MTESQLQPGDFVHYTHLGEPGIGKVKEAGPRPLVEFWSGKVERKDASGLTVVADAAPGALLWDSPEKLASWAKEKPLKLVALAMSVDGGKGKPASIKEKLDGRVPLGADWKSWWSKRAKSLNALAALPEPQYFKKSAKGNEYTLLCPVEKTPDDVTAPVSLADWKAWALSDVDLPTFGKNPSKVFCDSLSEWPGDAIERALSRLLWGAEVLLSSPKKPSAAALAWMDAVGCAALRWIDLHPDRHQLEVRSGEVLYRLSDHIKVKEKRKESTLFRAGIISEPHDRQRQLESERQEHERQRTEQESQAQEQLNSQRVDYESLRKREQTDYEAKLKELRRLHTSELERERRDLGAELKANREESRLEIRKDMLVVVGEVLQLVACRNQSSIEELVDDVEAGLRLAIWAGGADLLDTVPEGKLLAPGVIVRDATHGDLVLLKPRVKSEVI